MGLCGTPVAIESCSVVSRSSEKNNEMQPQNNKQIRLVVIDLNGAGFVIFRVRFSGRVLANLGFLPVLIHQN